MKLGTVVRSLASGVLVYLLMAACSASEHRGLPSGEIGNSEDGPGGGALSDALDRIIDGAGNPVPEASAAPTADVATEECSKSYSAQSSTYTYAEHAYPGATQAELASVIVIGTRAYGPPGFTQMQVSAWVRDGAVAVICGAGGATTYTKATFIRP